MRRTRKYWTLLSLMLPATLAVAVFYVTVFHYLIPRQYESLVAQKRTIVREVVFLGWQTALKHYRAALQGEYPMEEAQKRAMREITDLHWEENHANYFFIINDKGAMLAHPFHPELVGKNIFDLQDVKGTYITQELLKAVSGQDGGGFSEYLWDRPINPGEILHKLSFSRLFRPWGWIVVAGVYYDDILQEHESAKRNMSGVLSGTFALVAAMLCVMVWRGTKEEIRRERAEEELAQSEKRFRDIFNNTFQLTGMLAPDGTLLQSNDTALNAIRCGMDDVRGRLFWQTPWWTLKPEDGLQCKVMFEKACATKEMVRFESHHPGPDGSVIVADVTLKPLLDESGAVRCVIAEGRDITTIKRMEEHLRQTQKMDSIGQLAGGVAHDFNNMLGGILGAAEILLLGAQSEKDRKFIRLISETAERAADLTEKLLAFSRQGKMESVPLDVHQALQGAVDILERTIDRKIVLNVALDAAESVVAGDLTQLQNVFLNLGINAMHAMPGGGELAFSTTNLVMDETACLATGVDLVPGAYVEVRVRDTGTGIQPEHLPRIFDPFFTTKKQGQGTGLGLSAAYGTVREHHGAIRVYSEVGHGAEFFVLLPLVKAQGVRPPSSRTFVRGQGTILVVDDEYSIRMTTETMLMQMGYKVLLAANGREAVNLFEKRRDEIDLVLLDMIMPEMNGKDCYLVLRSLCPDVRVILSSGFDNTRSTDELAGLGVKAVLRKPYHSVMLSRMVSEVLKGA